MNHITLRTTTSVTANIVLTTFLALAVVGALVYVDAVRAALVELESSRTDAFEATQSVDASAGFWADSRFFAFIYIWNGNYGKSGEYGVKNQTYLDSCRRLDCTPRHRNICSFRRCLCNSVGIYAHLWRTRLSLYKSVHRGSIKIRAGKNRCNFLPYFDSWIDSATCWCNIRWCLSKY